jgi:DNA/RNA endonuclease YhcR with UshA esterase domain
MRMQKEEKTVIVLLLMALASLAVAYWTFDPDENSVQAGSATLGSLNAQAEINRDSITLEGSILNLKSTMSGGHLLISLDSTTTPVFIPHNSGAEELSSRLKIGDRIRLTGAKKSFQGKEEIEVSRSTDLQILSN